VVDEQNFFHIFKAIESFFFFFAEHTHAKD
jgi:hypothetical protein